jgi:hypothetical protein
MTLIVQKRTIINLPLDYYSKNTHSTVQFAKYKPRTNLRYLVENPIDFISLRNSRLI